MFVFDDRKRFAIHGKVKVRTFVLFYAHVGLFGEKRENKLNSCWESIYIF